MDHSQTVEQIDPEAAVGLLAQGAALIDVREPEEWSLGRAPEAVTSARKIAERLNELPRDRKLIMVCRSGIRSQTAAEALVEKGLPALNLAGGMQAWKVASFPVVADGAFQARSLESVLRDTYRRTERATPRRCGGEDMVLALGLGQGS